MKKHPDDDKVLDGLQPYAREMYAAGTLTPGTIVRTNTQPLSRRMVVAGENPLRVVPVKDF